MVACTLNGGRRRHPTFTTVMHERELVERLTRGLPRQKRSLIQGVGDDCAVIRQPGCDWLITTDSFLEGIHFKKGWLSWEDVGQKAFSAALSDIAAMGGRPLYTWVYIHFPKKMEVAVPMEIYSGLRRQTRRHEVIIAGGNTGASPAKINLHLTILGSVPKGMAILRSGAKPGDEVFVSGQIGSASLGLAALKEGKRGPFWKPFLRAYRSPTPRIALGVWLAKSGLVTSMIDISDGLGLDLASLAKASRVGLKLELEKIPRHPSWAEGAKRLGLSPRNPLLAGGEDYELAFTVRKGARLPQKIHLTAGLGAPPVPIGIVMEKSYGIRWLGPNGRFVKLGHLGYDPFR